MPDSVPRSARPPRWLVGGLTVLILALVLSLGFRWNSGGQKRTSPPASGPFLVLRPVTLVPGIHLLGRLTPAVAYVIETSAGLVLVDTGIEQNAHSLRQQMAFLGLDWMRLRAIFLTHAHGDHCGGAKFLRSATRAKLYAGQGDAALLSASGPREAFFGTFPTSARTPEPMIVDVKLKGNETVQVGDVRFRVLAAPGHSPGSLCYLLERGDQQVLFSGDVICSLAGDETTRTTTGLPMGWPLGTYSAYLAPHYRGNAKDSLATLRRLRALPVPDLVLPGHPNNDPEPQCPVLSQERWENLLDLGIREMERLLARYEKDGTNFLDGAPKRLLPDLYYLGECNDVAVYAFVASSKLFVVNAPAGVKEFLRARFRRLGVEPPEPAAVLLTSGDREVIEGLHEFLGLNIAKVAAPLAVHEAIKVACPAGTAVLSPENLAGESWSPLRGIALGGRGVGPTAYQLRWEGKSVLFTGRIPTPLFSPAWVDVRKDMERGRVRLDEYWASLQRLRELTPDLWLPAFPSCGQNANLYDSKWSEILAQNRALSRRLQ